MQISDWVDLTLYSLFTLGIIFVGIPSSLYLLKKGFEGWREFGCCNQLSNKFIDPYWGKTPLSLLVMGLVTMSLSMWYLFIAGGGLFSGLEAIKNFLLNVSFSLNLKDIMSISFSILIISLVSSIFFIKPKAKKIGNRYILNYNIMFKILGYSTLIVSILFYAFILEHEESILGKIVFFIILFSISVSIFLQFNRIKIEYDDEYIYLYSPWRKNRTIKWKDLIEYSYSERSHLYIIKTISQGNVHIPFSISGLKDFFERLSQEEILGFTVSS